MKQAEEALSLSDRGRAIRHRALDMAAERGERYVGQGGLFGAVSQALSPSAISWRVRPVDVRDEFCGYGSPACLPG